MNKYLKCAIVPVCICSVATALLAGVNSVTAPMIAEANAQAASASLLEVLPNAVGFEEVALPEDAPATVTGVFADTAGGGYAVTIATSSQYSDSPLQYTLGIGTDGLIQGVKVTNYSESKDFGEDYPLTYIGQDSALGGVDIVAGVTYSSVAFRDGVNDAFSVLFAVGDVAAGEKSEDQVVAEVVGQVIPGSVDNAGACVIELAELPADCDSSITAIYTTENNTGYAAVAGDVMYIFDAFAQLAGVFYVADGSEATSDDAVLSVATSVVTTMQQAASQSAIDRLGKIYKESTITPVTLTGVQNSVTGAYQLVTAEGETLYAMTAAPFGYGGSMKLLYVVNGDGAIDKFKVLSHDETEYYGAAVAEGGYTSAFEGQMMGNVADDVVTIGGCTFTTDAVKKAMADMLAVLDAVKEVQ